MLVAWATAELGFSPGQHQCAHVPPPYGLYRKALRLCAPVMRKCLGYSQQLVRTTTVEQFHLPKQLSGRIEARTGLRMMPTSPRSPLSFRTAGFPQYGWKDGVSDGAFPTRRSVQACSRHTLTTYWFASVLRASR